MEQNVIETLVVPEVPKVIPNQEIYVYVPVATDNKKGIASFDNVSFNISAGHISVKETYVNSLIDVKIVDYNLQVEEKLNDKVDKLITAGLYAYTHDSQTQGELIISVDGMENSLVKRDAQGYIIIDGVSIQQYVANETEELKKRTEVYLTADDYGNVYINGGDDE